jgi:carbonic anhydrase
MIGAAEGVQRLVEGNARFVRGDSVQHAPTRDELAHLADAQHPFATILGCSDSRVPPELVFDQGPGDLFIVRVAGNVVGTETLGSLGYALKHLATPLFVVLGHEGCGAVRAALLAMIRGTTEEGNLGEILDAIRPALQNVDPREPAQAQLPLAVEANVRWAIRQLASNSRGRAALARAEIQLVGAVYELTTGRVRFLDRSRQVRRTPPALET